MSDESQRHTDAERGRFDIRQLHRERFTVPEQVATTITRPHPALLGSPEERDAFADEMLRRERAAVADETFTEGRMHRKPPAPVNYHDEA